MFVVAQHKITDSTGFWNTVKQEMPNIPAGMKVHQVLPSTDGSGAICLWETPSVDKVKQFVDTSVGKYSSNSYFEVAQKTAVGLPGSAR